MQTLLKSHNACEEAREWALNKSWKQIFKTCHRGDWFLWLFKKTNPNDLQLLTLAKGHCANTVRHLMKDARSIKAVDISIGFGEGKNTREELSAAGADAYAAYAAAAGASAAAYAAAYAAAGASAAGADAYAAYAAAYAAGAGASAAISNRVNTMKANQLLTANICRQYLPLEVWNIPQDL
jgi:hypothetical protein